MPSCKRLISHWIFLRYFQHTDILYPIDNCELDQGQVLNYADCGTPAGTTLIWTREKMDGSAAIDPQYGSWDIQICSTKT